jgi:hypothetical protein
MELKFHFRSHEVIEECEDSLINEREIYWISHFDSTNHEKGYNLSKGGQGHSDETRFERM